MAVIAAMTVQTLICTSLVYDVVSCNCMPCR